MIKFNLKNIYTDSVSLKYLIILVTILLVFVCGYFFCLKSLLIEKNNIYSQVKQLEIKIKEQRNILSEYAFRQREISAIKKRYVFYTSNYSHIILLLLTGQLLARNFTIKELKILSVQKEKFFYEIWFKVCLLSNNINISEFLYQIENLQYIILLENFSWNFSNTISANSVVKKEIELLFHVYYYGDDPSNFNLAVSNLNRIIAKNLSTLQENILTQYPLSRFKMVGFLSKDDGERNWGFIKLPNSQIYKLKLGDSIGLERGLVMAINSKKIFVQIRELNKIIELSMGTGKFGHVMALSD
ncbi:MAG: type pilus biosis protein PilP [Pseudomonadota bacterium]|jgi:Tfp pilus assembly protein PilO